MSVWHAQGVQIVSNKLFVLNSSHSLRQFDRNDQPHTPMRHVPANHNPQTRKQNRNTGITTVFQIWLGAKGTREAKVNRHELRNHKRSVFREGQRRGQEQHNTNRLKTGSHSFIVKEKCYSLYMNN